MLLLYCRCRGLRESSSHGSPARSPGNIKNIPPAFPWVCLYLSVSPRKPLIVPISHSGDHLSDSRSSGGVVGFVVKVCSLLQAETLTLPRGFSSLALFPLKKEEIWALLTVTCSWQGRGWCGERCEGREWWGKDLQFPGKAKQRHQLMDF